LNPDSQRGDFSRAVRRLRRRVRPFSIWEFIGCSVEFDIFLTTHYSQVIPSQPQAKPVLKTKRKTAAVIPGPSANKGVPALVTTPVETVPATMAMEILMMAAPTIMSLRLKEEN